MDVTALRETSEALREAKRKLTRKSSTSSRKSTPNWGTGDHGRSRSLQAVMENVATVAGTMPPCCCWAKRERGRSWWRGDPPLSQRADKSFIKMNCAAIPSGLLESELFGNEKGAFAGR